MKKNMIKIREICPWVSKKITKKPSKELGFFMFRDISRASPPTLCRASLPWQRHKTYMNIKRRARDAFLLSLSIETVRPKKDSRRVY